ncbi:hypothetical protein LEP1GSC088_0848 [Leptospira interrogans str. L1207]|nr:hypothetical protein LEP1GSC088_0848 [Leptospira interrogans str. L1207]
MRVICHVKLSRQFHVPRSFQFFSESRELRHLFYDGDIRIRFEFHQTEGIRTQSCDQFNRKIQKAPVHRTRIGRRNFFCAPLLFSIALVNTMKVRLRVEHKRRRNRRRGRICLFGSGKKNELKTAIYVFK